MSSRAACTPHSACPNIYSLALCAYVCGLVAVVKKDRVVVGLSGGVDSSAAAALLVEAGYDVVGVTLKLWSYDCLPPVEDKGRGEQAIADARAVCHRLGIPHYILDESAEFRRRVVRYFADEYKAGRTPNPCVLCNQHLKFGRLVRQAEELGAPFVATGHYARIEKSPDNSRMLLERGCDLRRDQSYFLFALRQEQLARALFPLGEKTKTDARVLASRRDLRTADREESMEICFVPNDDYRAFLQHTRLVQKHRGEIVNLDGRVLGEHEGIEFYTIGQRRGLGLSSPNPLYVVELDAARNRVVVGDDAALMGSQFVAERCNWIAFGEPPARFDATVKIRYNHPGAPATITPLEGGRAEVRLHVPQRAITPGQAAVFYQDDLVLGGGWIIRG
ncbi:MAG TPA: tRNA 2-thiouridine(34) synthase MnmA [Verrucomicrobiota bacterium]|nr:tRNA 2-thiouridine(34) synthase MnmA [Verrucomicrobiota bacterium]HQL78455.1 tRNA 2-thiouridine(34) synthase MnmA [Verrucomicrobiota bacterium]